MHMYIFMRDSDAMDWLKRQKGYVVTQRLRNGRNVAEVDVVVGEHRYRQQADTVCEAVQAVRNDIWMNHPEDHRAL